MVKRFRKYITLLTIIFVLVAFSSISIYAWDNCPFGLEDDPYPGECKRYIDTDGDGICDLSQPAPEDRNTNISLNEENTIENIIDDSKYSEEIDGKREDFLLPKQLLLKKQFPTLRLPRGNLYLIIIF